MSAVAKCPISGYKFSQAEICAELCEAIDLRALGREWRGNDPRFSRIAYRLARNRLAALRIGDREISKWHVEAP